MSEELGLNEVLRVTPEGKFIWAENADEMIETGDFSASPAMPHILRALRLNAELVEALRSVVAWMDAPDESAFSDTQLAAARAALAKVEASK